MAKGILKMLVFAVTVVAALLQSSGAQTTFVVGDGLGWTIPPGGPIAYSTWASLQTFTVGDVLVFNFSSGEEDVAEVTKAAFNACNSTSPISISTTGPTNITLTSAGEHHFICTLTGHCNLGQKLAINVSAATPSPSTPAAPSPAAVPEPTASPAPTTSRAAVTYVVGEALGWNVLPDGAEPYKAWAASKSFLVGDTLVFNFANGTQNVAEVTKASYESCNTTNTLSLATTSPVRITLTTAGQHFFTCTLPQHCSSGQQLAITVTATSTTTTPPAATPAPSPTANSPPPTSTTPSPAPTTPSPSSPTTPPTLSPTSTTATPPSSPTNTSPPSSPSPSSGSTSPPPPPPGNSAPSVTIATLPVTLLFIAVALLH